MKLDAVGWKWMEINIADNRWMQIIWIYADELYEGKWIKMRRINANEGRLMQMPADESRFIYVNAYQCRQKIYIRWMQMNAGKHRWMLVTVDKLRWMQIPADDCR